MEKSGKKKILIFSTAYLPFVGGAEVAVREITNRLSSDFEFDLITAKLSPELASQEKIGQVTIYRIGSGRPTFDKVLLPFRGAFLALKLSKQNNYFCFWGIMATFGSGAGYICNIIRQLTQKKKIPMVLTLQEGDSENHLNYRWGGLIALSWKLALRRTDLLTGISTFLIHRAEKNGYKGDSVLVPNGVDLEIFSQNISEEIQEDFKNKLGKKQDDIFLVTVGRLTYKNATEDIIVSLISLPKHVSLIIIGKGDDGPKLQKLAETLGVLGRVKFLGFVPYEEIPKYLSACDIFVRPSRSEGFGNSFIEAMAAGLPVIATPVGGIPDFIDDRETGLFCAPDSPGSLAKAVETIMADYSLRQAMVVKAKARVSERYNWDYIAKKMADAFDKVS